MGGVVTFFASRETTRKDRKTQLKDSLVNIVVDIQKLGSQYWRSSGASIPDETLIKSRFDEFSTRLRDYGDQHSSEKKIKDIADHHKMLWDLITGGDFETSYHQADAERVAEISSHVETLNHMIRHS